MIEIGSILKNNFYRAWSRKNETIVFMVVTFTTMLLAVTFSTATMLKINIAVVSDRDDLQFDFPYVNIEVMEKTPPKSDLIMNKYCGVLLDRGNGSMDVLVAKNDMYRTKLEQLTTNPKMSSNQDYRKRGVASNILGYLIVPIFLQGLTYMKFFVEDRQGKMLKRIIAGHVNMGQYMVGHFLFSFIMVYMTSLFVLIIGKEVLKKDIGFGYGEYSYLLLVIVLLAISFAMFMTTIVEKLDNSMALSGTIIVLTSILSGSFNEVQTGNEFIAKVVSLFPQKQYLDMIQGVERGQSIGLYMTQIGYLLILSVALFGISSILCNIRFRKGRY
ncbi:MAG TPA: ABC transporter permease [Tissierellales bacterium]|nr:ABC transporter permease [Tissierellales bacterium]